MNNISEEDQIKKAVNELKNKLCCRQQKYIGSMSAFTSKGAPFQKIHKDDIFLVLDYEPIHEGDTTFKIKLLYKNKIGYLHKSWLDEIRAIE